MVINRAAAFTLTVGLALVLGACADSSSNLFGPTTAALPEKPAADPQCVALAAQIDALRKEGVADRLEEASKGKSTTVSVKRASLSKVAELNKANAAFQAKCSTVARPTATSVAMNTQGAQPVAANGSPGSPAVAGAVIRAKPEGVTLTDTVEAGGGN